MSHSITDIGTEIDDDLRAANRLWRQIGLVEKKILKRGPIASSRPTQDGITAQTTGMKNYRRMIAAIFGHSNDLAIERFFVLRDKWLAKEHPAF